MAGKRSNEPKVIISGATGLIGSALSRAVQADGKQVLALSHSNRTRGLSSIHWEPENNQLPREQLDGADAVVHLAGETLVGHWTEGKKRRIRNSRIHGTQLLAEALAARTDKPRVLLCASAVGYYGARG
ncbi:MAG: NAD-dependent epimerase/dehydratase family protein, partial [Planctomycetota bacterium]